LRSTCTTEFEANGNSCVFLVAGSGSAAAVTRGVDGLIPTRADSLTQSTATLQEWHDLARRTSFNIYSSQGDGKRIMQATTLKVINRKIDADIIAQLDTATNDTGGAVTADLDLVMHPRTILGVNEVPIDEEENVFGVITPAFEAYLMQVPEYASADFVDQKPFNGPVKAYRRWAGVNWIVHPRLTGVGTNSEKCYMYHKAAIGHAVNTGEMMVAVGYEQQRGVKALNPLRSKAFRPSRRNLGGFSFGSVYSANRLVFLGLSADEICSSGQIADCWRFSCGEAARRSRPGIPARSICRRWL
jgi:Phage capsid protein